MDNTYNDIFNNISANLTVLDEDFRFKDGYKENINQYTGNMNTYCTAEDLNSLASFNIDTNNNFKGIAKDTIIALNTISTDFNNQLTGYVLTSTLNSYYTKTDCDNKFWTISTGKNYVDGKVAGLATERYVQDYHANNTQPPAKFSGKSPFEVFYALTTEQINGAVPLDGHKYDLGTKENFEETSNGCKITFEEFKTFAEDLYNRSKKTFPPTVVTCTMDEYEDELDNNGECAKFGVVTSGSVDTRNIYYNSCSIN